MPKRELICYLREQFFASIFTISKEVPKSETTTASTTTPQGSLVSETKKNEFFSELKLPTARKDRDNTIENSK